GVDGEVAGDGPPVGLGEVAEVGRPREAGGHDLRGERVALGVDEGLVAGDLLDGQIEAAVAGAEAEVRHAATSIAYWGWSRKAWSMYDLSTPRRAAVSVLLSPTVVMIQWASWATISRFVTRYMGSKCGSSMAPGCWSQYLGGAHLCCLALRRARAMPMSLTPWRRGRLLRSSS